MSSAVDERRPLLDGESQGQTLASRTRRQLRAVFAPLAEPESLRPLERFLLFLSVALLLLASIFAGLFFGHRASDDHTGVGNPSPGGGSKEVACITADCVRTASDVLHAIDVSVDPCHDFYGFATGGWREEHPIPPDAGLFGIAQNIAAENAKVIQKLLDEAPSGQQAHATLLEAGSSLGEADKADQRNLGKLKDFYTSCMDRQAQNEVGARPVVKLVQQIRQRFAKHAAIIDSSESGPVPPNQPPGRSPVPHPPTERPQPMPPAGARQKLLTDALAWSHAHGFTPFFSWMIDGERVKDPTLGTPYLSPDGLGLADKDYYLDKEEIDFYVNTVKTAFTELHKEEQRWADKGAEMLSVPQKSGRGKRSFDSLSKDVVELEASLAAITPDGEEQADPLGTYNPITVAKLSYDLTSIDLPKYFKLIGVNTPKEIISISPKYVQKLDNLVSRTRDDVLEAYLVWTVLRTLGLALGPSVPLRRSIDALDRRSKGVDNDAVEDRSAFCQESLNSVLGFLAGRYFVRDSFPQQSKDKAESIIDDIIKAFKSRLPELDWLDPKTRRKAEAKADAVKVKVGWPTSPNTTNAIAMEAFYADLDIKPGEYLGNVWRSQVRGVRRDWAQAGKKLDEQRWDMFPAEVNAYYNPGGNEIVFPAGILQPAYFSWRWPDYLQYGAFGSVAGHELSHAFDPDGRLFDKRGALKDWWTPETAQAFNKRRDCLIDWYGNQTIPDGKGGELHLRSRFTIGEDIGDAGGLAQSWRAWRDSLSRQGAQEKNPLLPGLSYTREQLFYLAYAIGWARNIRQGELVRRLRTDPHSPTIYRVNAALANIESFADAWGCKAGKDPMARAAKDRCEIW
ncbi:zincin [Ceraceosorus guamensis]|uniref:Zincin n=1 Tax=Ceraceosorus guamensis TaxID=1522189 RepID=A0A316W952_9BASI|nr:zincin [Ceraceosorus guamensis]PWN44245.1 zincin [Ceraceosorus guamensis]